MNNNFKEQLYEIVKNYGPYDDEIMFQKHFDLAYKLLSSDNPIEDKISYIIHYYGAISALAEQIGIHKLTFNIVEYIPDSVLIGDSLQPLYNKSKNGCRKDFNPKCYSAQLYDCIIKYGDDIECLTSSLQYVRLCKKYFIEKENQ